MKILFISFLFLLSSSVLSNEIWLLDKKLSSIKFELPVLFGKNVKGKFNNFDGIVQINNQKNKNKAIFSVNLKSIEMNYERYKSLVLSNTFFYTTKFPLAIVDTKIFSYNKEKKLNLEVELTIKDVTTDVPLQLEIIKLAEELVQIKGELSVSRTEFHIGTGKWAPTAVLKDNISIKTNLFLFKK